MGNAGDKILYSSSSLSDAARRLQQVGAALQQERSGLLSTLSELDNGNGGDCRIQGRIHLTTVGASYSAGTIDGFIRDLAQALTAEGGYAKDLAGRLNKISEMFAATERELTGQINSLFEGDSPFAVGGAGNAVMLTGSTKAVGKSQATWKSFKEGFQERFGVEQLIAGGKYIKDIYGFIKDAKGAKSWKDWAKLGIDVYQFFDGAGKTFKNYMKIGNAVGKGKALTWWAKNVTGLKPLGRASTAKNFITRFKNNLTNKTSPFNAQLKDVVGKFTGAKGVGKAVAAWGAVAVDGVLNFFSNKDEQARSNGQMSDGRVWAETITETAVGTVLTYGASIVVGAAVTALAPVSVPGILVTAASGAVIAGVNAGITALTGKSATEWVSDTILDVGSAIGKGAQKAAKAIGNWFGKLSFA